MIRATRVVVVVEEEAQPYSAPLKFPTSGLHSFEAAAICRLLDASTTTVQCLLNFSLALLECSGRLVIRGGAMHKFLQDRDIRCDAQVWNLASFRLYDIIASWQPAAGCCWVYRRITPG